MPGRIDELSPDYVGKSALKLTLADPLTPPRAFRAVDVLVELDPTLSKEELSFGLELPLELLVTAPSPSGFARQVFRRVVPSTLTFTPKEGGEHQVMLREVGHNKWWGALIVDVQGEVADPRRPT